MVDDGRLEVSALESVRRLISSACIAEVDQPRTMVSTAVLDHLAQGWTLADSIAAVEELVAIRHNQMLIASGRRGYDEPVRAGRRGATVLAFRSRTFAA
jgi:hypothetical protein